MNKLLKYLTISLQTFQLGPHSTEEDQIVSIINEFSDHPSIRLIKSRNNSLSKKFAFKPVTFQEINKLLANLDPKKTSQENDIHTNILKENSELFAKYVYKDINNAILNSKFPFQLRGRCDTNI